MDDNIIRELKNVVGDQFSEVMSNTIVGNILHYVSICKKHNLDDTRLNLALQQYINEAKINGIKVPKSKGSKHSGTNVVIGDPLSYSNNKDLVNKFTGIFRKPTADMSISYPYGNTKYYLTEDIVGEGLRLCVDTDMRALLAWDFINQLEIKFDEEDKKWLTEQGYMISPYI